MSEKYEFISGMSHTVYIETCIQVDFDEFAGLLFLVSQFTCVDVMVDDLI